MGPAAAEQHVHQVFIRPSPLNREVDEDEGDGRQDRPGVRSLLELDVAIFRLGYLQLPHRLELCFHQELQQLWVIGSWVVRAPERVWGALEDLGDDVLIFVVCPGR